ncbi:hypothetical protein N7539_005266 [Penicillium diatomitis]|uniref:Uncharacterized protein n=1 Tax=Penicillium diatomitis TaxID=2819901 RepID=A0A9X0BUJ8_9EURO|nr:uncharacterized protein N7539_005266 [Penicillium diatomitis]KAJ5485278.1 hypothetical protein N7539_005266 [Penicillium diatomitis]
MQYKVDNESGRDIYRCYNDFGTFDGREIKNMVSKLVDFGLITRFNNLSTRNWVFILPNRTIKVLRRRSICNITGFLFPLVLVTISGLGSRLTILFGKLWIILGNKVLFQQVHHTNCQYDAKSHLAEMIA